MDSILKNKLQLAPKTFGCYLWKNKYSEVIYIGKAKNIFNRVHQYFTTPNNNKTARLVADIADVEFITVKNENEALILEANLIKKYKPKYNILLKENNGYPYILVTNEKKPRLLYTHEYNPKKGKYYGPFANSDMKAYDVYNLLIKLFPLKKCNSFKNTKCFYYDLGMCIGECVNEDTPEKYEKIKKEIHNFFTNGSQKVLDNLKEKEKISVQHLNFEAAKNYLNLQKSVKLISEKQIINLSVKQNVDFATYYVINNYISIVIFSYINGNLINKNSITTKFVGDVIDEVLLYLFQYYTNHPKPFVLYASLNKSASKLLTENLKIKLINPQKGKMQQIMELAMKNAKTENELNLKTLIQKEQREILLNKQLAALLNMNSIKRIELFDNSNIFNTDPVAAMVVYEDGKPNKKEYRKYKIKIETSKSDYEYMYEIIYRRFLRLIKEKKVFPDLLIVDGGHLQLNAASKALKELRIIDKVKLIGLVKNDKHKTEAIETVDHKKILLDKKSDLYFYLLNMQEEVHRFAISFFRKTNRKSLISSILDNIKGLGKNRKNKLLSVFDTISKIDSASIAELSQIIPKDVAIELKTQISKMNRK